MIAALKIVTAQKSVWQSHLSAVFRRGGVAPVSAMVLPKVIGCLPRSMRTSVSNACRIRAAVSFVPVTDLAVLLLLRRLFGSAAI